MFLLASLPFDMFYSHLILISLIIHTLIHLKRHNIKPVFTWPMAALTSVFLVTVLSTPYTINKTEAFNEWGRQVTIVVLPLLFCLNPLDLKKYRSDFFITFILVCTATIIYLYADAVVTIRHYGLPYHALFSAAFTNHNFSEPIDIHATFFSMQVAIALVFTISLMLTQKTPFINLLLFISAFILSAGLIQLGSKSVCIALLFIINIAIPWFLLNGIPRWRFIMLSAMVSVLLMILIMSQHDLKNRFAGELKSDLSSNPSTTIFDSRLARWRSAMQLIKQAPLTGHGAGSEITLLHDEYYKNGLYNSFVNHLNTHNEYLSFLIKSGIVGLLIYLATLAYGFSIAFKNKDLLFFSFMLLIAMVSLSENLLDVDKGICFYAIFFSLFIFMDERQPDAKNTVEKSGELSVERPALLSSL
jgi:O-antigen ligase